MAEPSAGLARNTTVMAVGTVLSRLTGFGRDFALAYAFGFTRFTDSYNIANNTPNILYELVLGGVLAASLLPVFVQRLVRPAPDGGTAEDEDDGWYAVSAVVTAAGVAAVLIAGVVAVAAPWVVHAYTFRNDSASLAEQREVATFLLRLFAPQVAFLGLFTVATALLNAQRRFAAPMFTPILNNLVAIAVILTFPRLVDGVSLGTIAGERAALLWLGLGTTAGYALQAIGLGVALRRAGARLRFVWDLGHDAVRTVVRLSGWTLGFVVANQLALFAVYALANERAGQLSAYQAAFRFFQLPHAVLAVSIMSALQPELADRWHRGAPNEFRARLSSGVRLTVGLLVPAAVGYVLLARPLIGLVLQHGALGEASATTTADTLAWFAIGLPGFSVFLLFTRAYQAMQDTRSVFVLYTIENGVNVILAVALFPAFGVQGLAASYAIAYAVAAVLAAAHMRGRLGGLDGRNLAGAAARTLGAAAVMGAVVAAVVFGVPGDGAGPDIARVGAAVVAGAVTYAAMARLLGLRDVLDMLRVGGRASSGHASG